GRRPRQLPAHPRHRRRAAVHHRHPRAPRPRPRVPPPPPPPPPPPGRPRATRARISAADRLSPHSVPHAFATTARAEGVPLEDVQDAMGHADPRTTRRYDRDRHNLDRDPAYTIAAARARRAGA